MTLCFKRYFGSTNVSMIKAKFISRRFTKLLIVLDGLKARGLIKNILDGRFVKLTINDHRSIVWCLKEKRGKKKCNSVLYLPITTPALGDDNRQKIWWVSRVMRLQDLWREQTTTTITTTTQEVSLIFYLLKVKTAAMLKIISSPRRTKAILTRTASILNLNHRKKQTNKVI